MPPLALWLSHFALCPSYLSQTLPRLTRAPPRLTRAPQPMRYSPPQLFLSAVFRPFTRKFAGPLVLVFECFPCAPIHCPSVLSDLVVGLLVQFVFARFQTGRVCWLFIFKVTEPSSIPYRTHPACAKRAAYPDPPPVICRAPGTKISFSISDSSCHQFGTKRYGFVPH